ncbi:MAG: hypothetical protein GY838_03150 [bacterium]|nr:hypothetical protein [bacterium]
MLGNARRTSPTRGSVLILALLSVTATVPARAGPHPDIHDPVDDRPDGIHVIDGSYVINVGNLQVNITNHGLIGSQFTDYQPFSSAPSAQWPGGSGHEYLYGAGLWVGARVAGDLSVTTGQPVRELRPEPDILATIYEARRGKVLRPVPSEAVTGRRLPDPRYNDDRDSSFDEDGLNGIDDDGDGAVDEDFGQIGDQMMVATMHDDTRLAQEIYPEHRPLGITVTQRVAGWSDPDFDDFVALDYEIHNASHRTLNDLYLGFYVDCDIQRRDEFHTEPDDLAGYFNGVARGPRGRFHRLQIAWMRDGAEEDPLPGVFGVMMLDHTTDFAGLLAPKGIGVTGYRSFTLGASYNQGGEPLSDADRYAMMSDTRIDRDTYPEEANDFRFLISTGPFKYVKRDVVLRYRLAMVVGSGMQEMLTNALNASIVQRGAWFDADYNYYSGLNSRETKVCFGDYSGIYGVKPLELYRADLMDETCTGTEPRIGYTIIQYDPLVFVDEEGRRCIWANTDNCEECFQGRGEECQPPSTGEGKSALGPPYEPPEYVTGTGGREHRAAWLFAGPQPPVLPATRVVPGDGQVEIYWDNRSEYDTDDVAGVIDFESYRIWRVTNWVRPEGVDEHQMPPAELWGMIAEYDRINTVPAGVGPSPRDLPLGANTGLADISYVPVCLSDPRFEGVPPIMRRIVDGDPRNRLLRLPSLRLPNGSPREGYTELLPWEHHAAVLDTLFAVTNRWPDPARGILAKSPARYYRYVDTEVHNNFVTYYSVTSRDHELAMLGRNWVPAGFGVETAPGINYTATRPRHTAQTAAKRESDGTNIYVYPNPVTREALVEFDLQETTWDNPTGAQIIWANLPAAHNTITIYTAAGDLIQTIRHDGTGGDGTVAWNLVSRNHQEIVSGIYLYVVESADSRFDDYAGRFVVIW